MKQLLASGMLACVTALAGSASLAQEAVRDDRGAVVVVKSPPQRIVSLLPSLTESVCAIGACARLVGVDRYSNWPASVLALPRLGGLDDTPIERIVALHPDLVLVASSARVVDRLEALGITVAVLEPRDRADAKRSLETIARLLGTPAEAARVWAEIERETRAAAARVPTSLRGQKVYFEVDEAPYAAGPTSFIGETLAQLGLSSALPATLGPFPKLNPEYVVRLQPDLIMAGTLAIAEMPKRPGWATLHALREFRTCGFATANYEVLIRPGPRMGEAAGRVADCLEAIAARAKATTAH